MNKANKGKLMQGLLCVLLALFIGLSHGTGTLAFATETGTEDTVVVPGFGGESEAVYEDRLVILLDTSGSMKGKEEYVQQALLNTFAVEYGNQQNEETLLTTLILFNEGCYVFGEVDLGTAEGRAQYTSNLTSAVKNTIPKYTCWQGRTMIGVALEQAYKCLENSKGKGTILLFSDGGIYNANAEKAAADEQLSFKIALACAEKDIPIYTCGLDKGSAETRFEYQCNGVSTTQREFLGALSGTAQKEYADYGVLIAETSGSYNKYRITVSTDPETGKETYGVSHTTEDKDKAEELRSLLTPDLEGMASFFSSMLNHFNIDVDTDVIYAEYDEITPYKFEITGSDTFLSAVELTLSCSTATLGTADSTAGIRVTAVKQPNGDDVTASTDFSSLNPNTLRVSITNLPEDGVYCLDINNKSGKSVLLSVSIVFKYDFSMEVTADAGKAFGDTAFIKASLVNGKGDSKQQIISKSVLESCKVTVEKCYYSKNSQSSSARLDMLSDAVLSVDTAEGLFALQLNSLLGGSLVPGEYKVNLRCEYQQSDDKDPLVRTASVFFTVPEPCIEIKAAADRLLFGHGTEISISVYKDDSKTQTAALPETARVYYSIDGGKSISISPADFNAGRYVLKTERFSTPKTVSIALTVSFDDPSTFYRDVFKEEATETIVVSGPVFGVKRADNSPVYYNSPLSLKLGAYTTSSMDEAISADVPITGNCKVVITQGDKVVHQESISAADIKSQNGAYLYTYKNGFKATGAYTVSVYADNQTKADTSIDVTVTPYVLKTTANVTEIKHTMDKGDSFENTPIALDNLFTLTDTANGAVSGISVSDYITEYGISGISSKSGANGGLSAKLINRTLSLGTSKFDQWTVKVSYTAADGQTGEVQLVLTVDKIDHTLRNVLIICGAILLLAAAAVAIVLLYKTKVPSDVSFRVVADNVSYPVFNYRSSYPSGKATLYDILTDYPFLTSDNNAQAVLRTLAADLTDKDGNVAQRITFKGSFINKVYVIDSGKSTAYTLAKERFQTSESKHTLSVNGHYVEIYMSKS